MRRGAALAIVAATLVVLRSVPASAEVGEFLGQRIVSIAVRAEARTVSDPKLIAMVETRVGQPLAMASVRETITHMFSLGEYEDVRVHAAAATGGVALVYELVPLHPVTGVSFSGLNRAAGVDEGRLRQAITDRFGSTPRVGRALDIARVLEDELHEAGYLRAKVTPRTDIEHAVEQSTLMFAVDPGDRTYIGAIDVQGASSVPARDLLERLDLKPGAPYVRTSLIARIDRYVESRRRRGFYAAQLTVSPRLSEGDRVVDLTFNISEGPHVRVVFKGDALPADRREELVPIAREGSADEDLLEDSSNRIEAFLRSEGYREAAAPHAREDAGGELLITFTVNKGPLFRVGHVEIVGNSSIPTATLEARLRVREGQPFSAASVEADRAAVEDIYRREGFAAARAEASADAPRGVQSGPAVPVPVRITVTENVRTVVNSVQLAGHAAVDEAALRQAISLQPGQPFFVTQMALDRDAIQVRYANLGYQNATVDTNPGISADRTRADVVFTVREGPRMMIDHVLIVGNVRTRTATVERELQFKPGDPLSLSAISDTQRRLAALGLFRRVRITELGHGDETSRDVLVTVEEAPVTTIGYGGGVEVVPRIRPSAANDDVGEQQLELAPRAFFEIGRRNLFGKNRSVNLFTRVSLSKDQVRQPQPAVITTQAYGFSEYRVLGTFREPRVAGTAADAFLTAAAEQQVRTSYNFARRTFSAEVGRRVTRNVSVSGNYQIQRSELFDKRPIDPSEALLVDRIFPQVRLSSFSQSTIRDTRDDALDPSSGHYLSANGQIAARVIGSEVGFAKTFLTAQMFRVVPRSKRTVFAGDARLGMATAFPRTVLQAGVDGRPIVVTVTDLPASERFFAGGDTTVRGFALDQLGTPDTLDKGFPSGGNALIIFNAEVRLPVRGGLGVVAFFDTGNVFANTSDMRLTELRSTVGFGVRYKSPVGPIRVDLGFKTHRNEVAPGVLESSSALHISLGQAF